MAYKSKTGMKENEWRQTFKQVALECKERIRSMPKGERFNAFRECMKQGLARYRKV